MFEFKFSITPSNDQKFKDKLCNTDLHDGLEFLHELTKELGALIIQKFEEPELRISNLIVTFKEEK